MTTTDTRSKLGITVAKDLRTVMQGKVAIAGEASYEGASEIPDQQARREVGVHMVLSNNHGQDLQEMMAFMNRPIITLPQKRLTRSRQPFWFMHRRIERNFAPSITVLPVPPVINPFWINCRLPH